MPGRLSVSRTFGDAEAKLKATGGNPNVIIAEPDIKSFKITQDHDFIILGCKKFAIKKLFYLGDGIFDKLTNKDVIKAAWETVSLHKYKNVHEFCGKAVENMMRESLLHKTLDNITIVFIGFKNLKETLFGNKTKTKENLQNVDKNGNLIIDSNYFINLIEFLKFALELELIEYKYFPDNPNEPSFEEHGEGEIQNTIKIKK